MDASLLLQRYRSDRRKILEFVLRSNLIKQIRFQNGIVDISDVDLDTLSVDYVLDCVNSGGVVDIVEATKKYHDESASSLIMIHSHLRDSFYLISNSDLAGSPPQRVPPPIISDKTTKHVSHSSDHWDPVNFVNGTSFGTDYYTGNPSLERHSKPAEVPALGLRSLKSELSDENLHETAYEILLASMAFSGIEIHRNEYGRKEKASKLLQRLKSKKDKIKSESQTMERDLELIASVRMQMQISEAMDGCIRQNLMKIASRNLSAQISVPQISLGLLSGISLSDFLNEKVYLQWKNRQTPYAGINMSSTEI